MTAVLTGTIERIEGTLCVRYETTYWTEPIRVVQYWPIGRIERDAYRPHSDTIEGEQVDAGSGDSPFYGKESGLSYYLKNGGQTEPIKREETPVGPPRTVKPIRWNKGQWEKELKRGWVPA